MTSGTGYSIHERLALSPGSSERQRSVCHLHGARIDLHAHSLLRCKKETAMTTPTIYDTQPVTVQLFKYQQAVMTPNGRATFVNYLDDGARCTVSRLVNTNGRVISTM